MKKLNKCSTKDGIPRCKRINEINSNLSIKYVYIEELKENQNLNHAVYMQNHSLKEQVLLF